jgi:hypothetical protein
MYAISLYQPWASAMFTPRETSAPPLKAIETRSWAMRGCLIGQRVAIHATRLSLSRTGVREQKEMWKKLKAVPHYRAAFAAQGITDFLELPFGCVLGSVMMLRSIPAMEAIESGWADDTEQFFGNYLTGRHAWLTSHPIIADKPIPISGKQGVWIWKPPAP